MNLPLNIIVQTAPTLPDGDRAKLPPERTEWPEALPDCSFAAPTVFGGSYKGKTPALIHTPEVHNQAADARGRGRLANLQVLRGLAALGVVVFHAANRRGLSFEIGQAGVDVFFVISGYIMLFTTTKRPISTLPFLADRLARIGPMYWGATLVLVAGGGVGLFPRLAATFETLILSILFVPYRSAGHYWPLLVPGWTLNYEMFFYAIFGVCLCAPARARPFLLLGILASIASAPLLFGPLPWPLDFYSDPIVLEFALGIIIASWSLGRSRSQEVGWAALAIGMFGLGASLLPHPVSSRVVYWGLPAAAIVVGMVWLEQSGRAVRAAPILLAGDASYSIYLGHPFVVALGGKLPHSMAPWFSVLLITVGSVILGALVHLIVERPLVSISKRLRAARGLRILTAGTINRDGVV